MKARDLIAYCRELGWTDPLELTTDPSPPTGPSTGPSTGPTSRQAAAQVGRRPAGRAPHPAGRGQGAAVTSPGSSDLPGSSPAVEHAAAKTASGPSLPSTPDATASTGASDVARCTSLEELAHFLDGCQRCRLARTRRSLVLGEGDPDARVMMIGEGPGDEEDRTGRPLVGQAGQLLDAMILALGLTREQVYIANVIKCRPPRNRQPKADETATCAPFLDRQIDLVRPEIIVALGRPATQRLTGSSRPLGALRGSWAAYRGLPVLPTFHPAYLLCNPADKRLSWDDLKLVRQRLHGPASGGSASGGPTSSDQPPEQPPRS